MKEGRIVAESSLISVTLAPDEKTIVLSWENVSGLTARDFRAGLAGFAVECKAHRPARAVIDAGSLEPDCEAVGWVSGQLKLADTEDYGPWWIREIVSVYNDAGLSSVAVATGNPNAPGELTDPPPAAKFKMGFFPDLETAMKWNAGA